MAGDVRFAPLAADMGALGIDDYKRKLQARRKGLNADRNTIPARLDEQRKAVETLREIDFPTLRAQREAAVSELRSLQEELVRISHGAQLEAKRNELAGVRNELDAAVNENNSHRQSQMVSVSDRRPELKAAIEKAQAEAARWADLVRRDEDLIAQQDSRIQSCRDLWAAADGRVFSAKVCPTCGQQLPAAAQAEAQRRFEEDKERAKADAVDRANTAKAARQAAESRREEERAAEDQTAEEVRRLTAELAAYTPDAQPAITDLPGYAERVAVLNRRASQLEEEVRQLEGETSTIRSTVETNIQALRAKADALEKELAKEALLAFAEDRCNELAASAKKAAEELSSIDHNQRHPQSTISGNSRDHINADVDPHTVVKRRVGNAVIGRLTAVIQAAVDLFSI